MSGEAFTRVWEHSRARGRGNAVVILVGTNREDAERSLRRWEASDGK